MIAEKMSSKPTTVIISANVRRNFPSNSMLTSKFPERAKAAMLSMTIPAIIMKPPTIATSLCKPCHLRRNRVFTQKDSSCYGWLYKNLVNVRIVTL
jgi:hypothetical protein